MKTRIPIISALLIICITLPNNTGCSSGTQQRENCLEAQKMDLQKVPFNTFLMDIARFENEVATPLNNRYARLASNGNRPAMYGKQASLSCTFSLKRLKSFIFEFEQIAAAKGVPADSLGITWFYAVYDNNNTHIMGTDTDYRSLQTLYGLPSIFNATTTQPLIFTSNVNTDGDTLDNWMPIDKNLLAAGDELADKEIAVITPTQTSNRSGNAGTRQAAFNMGQLCPPSCPENLIIINESSRNYEPEQHLEN